MAIAKIKPKGKPKSNEQNVFLMTDSQGFTNRLLMFEDVGLGDPDYKTHPPVEVVNWRKTRAGKKVRRSTTVRGEQISQIMYELNLAEGYTVDEYMLSVTRGNCSRNVFIYDECEESFTLIQNAVFDEIRKRTTPLQSAKEDGAPLSHYSKFYGYEMEYHELGFYVQQSAVSQALYGVAFKFVTCSDCDPLSHQDGVYVGGGRLVAETSNQFATGTAISAAIPTSTIGTAVLVDGDITYVAFADNIDPATATAGGVVKIANGVSTTVLSVAKGMYALALSDQYLWAFGATGFIYKSADGGNTFTQVTNSVMASTHFMRAAYEPRSGQIYLAGHNGTDGKAGKFDGNVIKDITANVGTLTAKKLHAVKVLSKDTDDFGHVAFGGDAGFFAECGDTEAGDTFSVVTVPNTTDPIKGIAGDSWRTAIGGGSQIHVRSIYTQMEFKTEVASGITGNITDADTGLTDYGVDYMVFVTNASGTSGNIVMLRPAVSAL